MEPLPNTRKPSTTPIDVNMDSAKTPPTVASIGTNLIINDQPMKDRDGTATPPPSTLHGTTSTEPHKRPPSPDGNKPSTFFPTALQLPPPVRHYHGPKQVPTQDETLTWSSKKCTSFVTNYIGGMSEWVPEYLLKYHILPKPSAFYNKPDPRLEVGTEDALRYLANAHHAIAEKNGTTPKAKFMTTVWWWILIPLHPLSSLKRSVANQPPRTSTCTSTPLYRLIHKSSS